MRKQFLLILATILMFATFGNFSVVKAESQSDLDKKINELEKEQGELNNKKDSLEKDKSKTKNKMGKNLKKQDNVLDEIDSVDKKLSKTSKQINTKETEITTTNKKIKDLDEEIKQLKKEIEELKDRIAKRDKLLKNRLRSIQKSGGSMKYIEVILGAKSFSDFINRSTAVNTIMDQDQEIMEEQEQDKQDLQDNQKSVVAKKTDVEAKKVALVSQKKELVGLKDELDSQLEKKETLIAKLEGEYDDLEEYDLTLEEEQAIMSAQADSIQKAKNLAQKDKQKLQQLAKEKAAAEKKAAEAARAAKEKKSNSSSGSKSSGSSSSIASSNDSPPAQSGNFIRPVSNGITSGFGGRNSPGGIGSTNHQGVDFGSPIGTPVKASASGNIRTAGSMGGYGTTVMIDHYVNGKVYTTLYGHLSSLSVSSGQSVSQGQVIGKTGNTGNSTGPHLHFEIHPGGWRNAANPMQFIN